MRLRLRLRLLLAVGVVGIVIASLAASRVDGGPPRPPRCHGTKDCARHRYELFAVTFKATQHHVWTLPRGDAGVVNECGRTVSGSGDMTLTLEAPRPTYALVAHGPSPWFYWRSPSGATNGGFDVRATLNGFGWILNEYAPVGPRCPRAYQVPVGSADPAACRTGTVIELLYAEEEIRDGWLGGLDGPKNRGPLSSECPIASYSELLPRPIERIFGKQDLRLLTKAHNEPYASRPSTRKVFDCQTRTLTSTLQSVRRHRWARGWLVSERSQLAFLAALAHDDDARLEVRLQAHRLRQAPLRRSLTGAPAADVRPLLAECRVGQSL
jgi:hypothetical protein